MGRRTRVVFLISATGGGHRAAAEAVAAGLEALYPGVFEFLYVDAFREYFGFPLRKAPEIYSRWVSLSARSYGLAFLASDLFYRLPFTLDGFQGRTGRRLLERLRALDPDLLVAIHALLVRPAAAGRERLRLDIPLVTVVTDFARPHAGWFHPAVDLLVAAGPGIGEHARRLGIPEGKVVEVGLLVHPRFAGERPPKGELRERLGLDPGSPVILFLGGGEGMGKLGEVVDAADRALRGTQFLVVCGRNRGLREKLQRKRWRNIVRIHGFVEGLEAFMWAADILVTKAGPLSIAEGLTVGLPLLIYDAVPYQEVDNARWVERSGAGRFVKDPRRAAEVLWHWISDRDELARRAERARAAADPGSAYAVAAAIGRIIGLPAARRGGTPR
ncbi:MGDG synthase family glycosyltransferase [Candidatus Bipolaricaulota sp. J31]